MRRRFFLLLIALLPAALPLRADEGMWLVQAITAVLQQRMEEKGLELDTKLIYDAEHSEGTLCGAVVSMDFIGTGSVVSPDGLVITNHHVAYSDLAALGLLETGFWARSRDEELRIPKKKVQILRQIIDVTEETRAVADSLAAKGIGHGMRKLSFEMEKRYARPGYEAALQSMWAGEKYYLARYEVYDDVRLVAAPPVSVAAFGGDEDNWEWPQHKGDFALYRIYRDGEPLRSPWHLHVSTEGVREGDFTMVLGYPGRTYRYGSSFEMRRLIGTEWPLTTEVRGQQMEILRRWMDADPVIREKYADRFFSLSNVQEMQVGELQCARRFHVAEAREALEAQLDRWIAADPQRKSRWGSLLQDLRDGYAASAEMDAQRLAFRETMIRGSFFAPTVLRMANAPADRKDAIYAAGLSESDARVETELLAASLKAYFRLMKSPGPKQQALYERFGEDWTAFARYLWDHPEAYAGMLLDVQMASFRGPDLTEPRRGYVQALYAMREDQGIAQYPDANSSLRLSYGKVCSLHPWDAVECSWYTGVRGLFEKNDPSRHDFALPEDFLAALPEYSDPVNFIADLDITGGNSGSPVLDRHGAVVGLAFDGNKESLSSDYYLVADYTRCVCVDIRYVLFILGRYAGLTDIVAEMTL